MSKKKDTESLGNNVQDLEAKQQESKKQFTQEDLSEHNHKHTHGDHCHENCEHQQSTVSEDQSEKPLEDIPFEGDASPTKNPREDFLSFYEMNFLLRYFTKNRRQNGFRQGHVPVQLLQAQNPELMDHIFNLKCHQRSQEIEKDGLYAKLNQVIPQPHGFTIIYDLLEIPKSEANTPQEEEEEVKKTKSKKEKSEKPQENKNI